LPKPFVEGNGRSYNNKRRIGGNDCEVEINKISQCVRKC